MKNVQIHEDEESVSIRVTSIQTLIMEKFNFTNMINKTNGERYLENEYSTSWTFPFMSKKELFTSILLGNKMLSSKLKKKVKELEKITGDILGYNQKIKVVKRKIKMSEQGDELDIHAVYRGRIDKAWRKTERIEVDSKFHLVTLLINIGGSSGESTINSLWGGAVVEKIYGQLIKSGKSVRVIIVDKVSGIFVDNGKHMFTTFNVKEYNRKLSSEVLSVLTCLSVFRTIGIAVKALSDKTVTNFFGYPEKINKIDMKGEDLPYHLREEFNKGETKFIVINPANSEYSAVEELNSCYSQMKSFLK